MAYQSEERPSQNVRYAITDSEARDVLDQLAEDGSDLRKRLETEDPAEVLREYNIEITGIPTEGVVLPPAEDIRSFIDQYLPPQDMSNNVGYAILYFMLGAMPLVVVDPDGAP
ncbi:MAG TPA: hypothetical protein VKB07_13610 [Gaiellaceae bacterium]|nr:hypothetical protein [Gaiellaceae bacterium]